MWPLLDVDWNFLIQRHRVKLRCDSDVFSGCFVNKLYLNRSFRKGGLALRGNGVACDAGEVWFHKHLQHGAALCCCQVGVVTFVAGAWREVWLSAAGCTGRCAASACQSSCGCSTSEKPWLVPFVSRSSVDASLAVCWALLGWWGCYSCYLVVTCLLTFGW